MRNRILGAIGVLWGGAILLSRLVASGGESAGNAAYRSGQTAGTIFGVLLLAVGLYYLLKKRMV